MTTRILLVCAFGVDIADQKVDYWNNGKLEKRTVGYSLENTFNNLIQRIVAPHVQFLPFFADCFITRWERETKWNAEALRAFCQKVIDNRRREILKDPNEANKGDFLTLLLCDKHF